MDVSQCSQPTLTTDRQVFKITFYHEPMMREEPTSQLMMQEEQVNNFVLHQATIVALTSEFIQRQYYMFQVNVPNNTLDGYVDFTFTGKSK